MTDSDIHPAASTGFAVVAVEPVASAQFDNAQVLDGDGLVNRFGSVSVVASMDEQPRARLRAAVRALAGGASVGRRWRSSACANGALRGRPLR